jgi:hypothetical protein
VPAKQASLGALWVRATHVRHPRCVPHATSQMRTTRDIPDAYHAPNWMPQVPTHNWIPTRDGSGVAGYCYMHLEAAGRNRCRRFDEAILERFRDGLTLCFTEALKQASEQPRAEGPPVAGHLACGSKHRLQYKYLLRRPACMMTRAFGSRSGPQPGTHAVGRGARRACRGPGSAACMASKGMPVPRRYMHGSRPTCRRAAELSVATGFRGSAGLGLGAPQAPRGAQAGIRARGGDVPQHGGWSGGAARCCCRAHARARQEAALLPEPWCTWVPRLRAAGHPSSADSAARTALRCTPRQRAAHSASALAGGCGSGLVRTAWLAPCCRAAPSPPCHP